jgi:hypothetical protein
MRHDHADVPAAVASWNKLVATAPAALEPDDRDKR